MGSQMPCQGKDLQCRTSNKDSMRFRLHSPHQGSHSQASNKDSMRLRLHSLHQGSHSQASKDSLRFRLHSPHQGSHTQASKDSLRFRLHSPHQGVSQLEAQCQQQRLSAYQWPSTASGTARQSTTSSCSISGVASCSG